MDWRQTCASSRRCEPIFAREDELIGTYSSDSLSISTACGGECSDHRIVTGEVTLRIRE